MKIGTTPRWRHARKTEMWKKRTTYSGLLWWSLWQWTNLVVAAETTTSCWFLLHFLPLLDEGGAAGCGNSRIVKKKKTEQAAKWTWERRISSGSLFGEISQAMAVDCGSPSVVLFLVSPSNNEINFQQNFFCLYINLSNKQFSVRRLKKLPSNSLQIFPFSRHLFLFH